MIEIRKLFLTSIYIYIKCKKEKILQNINEGKSLNEDYASKCALYKVALLWLRSTKLLI